jgi:glycosidase
LTIEGFLESQKTHSQPSSPSKVHTPPSPYIAHPSSPPKYPTPVVHTPGVTQILYAFPYRDYMKYLPRFNGEGEVTTKENLTSFYSFAYNFNVEHTDVWMRLFVQSLDGEVRKWFRGLPANSIADIDALDEVFLKQWGDKKDCMYYITKFGALRRKNGESVSDFTKRFNKMYSKILDEIKPRSFCKNYFC